MPVETKCGSRLALEGGMRLGEVLAVVAAVISLVAALLGRRIVVEVRDRREKPLRKPETLPSSTRSSRSAREAEVQTRDEEEPKYSSGVILAVWVLTISTTLFLYYGCSWKLWSAALVSFFGWAATVGLFVKAFQGK